jgi:hypothetical protein
MNELFQANEETKTSKFMRELMELFVKLVRLVSKIQCE